MNEPTIDPTVFAELQQAAGAEFISELIDTFLEEAPTMFDEMRDVLAKRDAERYRRAAHSLKSNSNTFGAFKLGAMAREIELKGMSPDPAVDATALDALASEYARVASALKGLRHA
ncbi:MAG: Hpt domain-containing protein [Burkholderiaceae bacterium]